MNQHHAEKHQTQTVQNFKQSNVSRILPLQHRCSLFQKCLLRCLEFGPCRNKKFCFVPLVMKNFATWVFEITFDSFIVLTRMSFLFFEPCDFWSFVYSFEQYIFFGFHSARYNRI